MASYFDIGSFRVSFINIGKRQDYQSVENNIKHLTIRIILALMITLITSGLLILFLHPEVFHAFSDPHEIDRNIQAPALKWAIAAIIGILAGWVTRWQLNKLTLSPRLLVLSQAGTAVLALSSSLWLAGWITEDFIGFSLTRITPSRIDWDGLTQLVIGSLSAGLALLAWRITTPIKIATRKTTVKKSPSTQNGSPKRNSRKTIKSDKSTKPKKPLKTKKLVKSGKPQPSNRKSPTAVSRKKPATSTRRKPKVTPRKIKVDKNKFLDIQGARLIRRLQVLRSTSKSVGTRLRITGHKVQTQLKSSSQTTQIQLRTTGRVVQNRLQTGSQTAQARLRGWFTSKSSAPSIQLPKRDQRIQKPSPSDSPIRMVGEMEHRCPFCLEVIERNDPRGVRICSICHTHHHADCWAVTGTCQVPHHHD